MTHVRYLLCVDAGGKPLTYGIYDSHFRAQAALDAWQNAQRTARSGNGPALGQAWVVEVNLASEGWLSWYTAEPK